MTEANPVEEFYDIKDEIGRGAFSVVKVGIHRKTGKKFAIKIIEKTNLGADLNRLQTEIKILKQVDHPNIIKLKELFETSSTLAIVTELVTGGELFDKIVEQGSYSEKDASILVAKMVSAIDYLHKRGIVHRDLKPENLLLKDENSITEVKIADFGLSKIVGTNFSLMLTACGTPSYVAPEVLTATGYDKEVDLWSIGVITYILLCGFPPFYNENISKLFEEIMQADYDFPDEYWAHISDKAKDFVSKLLVSDPSRRLTAAEALQHPWISQLAPGSQKSNMGNKFNEKLKKYVLDRKSQTSFARDL